MTVIHPSGLCPETWHVPENDDWQQLGSQLGGLAEAGVKLKSTYGWRELGNGTNEVGFNAHASGDRYAVDGEFYSSGNAALWWSSTPDSSADDAWIRFYFIEYYNDELKTEIYPRNNGMAVRCLKD